MMLQVSSCCHSPIPPSAVVDLFQMAALLFFNSFLPFASSLVRGGVSGVAVAVS